MRQLCGVALWHVWYAPTHTQSSIMPGSWFGVKEVELETRPTDAIVGGTGIAGCAPLQRQICDTNRRVDEVLL